MTIPRWWYQNDHRCLSNFQYLLVGKRLIILELFVSIQPESANHPLHSLQQQGQVFVGFALQVHQVKIGKHGALTRVRPASPALIDIKPTFQISDTKV